MSRGTTNVVVRFRNGLVGIAHAAVSSDLAAELVAKMEATGSYGAVWAEPVNPAITELLERESAGRKV